MLGVLLAELVLLHAPVTAVTVYGDRARVTRSGAARLAGAGPVEFPLLPDSADPASVRVEAQGDATLGAVTISRADEASLPRDEAADVLAKLDALDEKLAKARGERASYAAELAAATRLAPTVPEPDALHAPPKLDPSGWAQSGEFAADLVTKLSGKARDAGEKAAALEREREPLAEKARLLGAGRRRTGWRVTAWLSGHSAYDWTRAQVSLVYIVHRARWAPVYDLQLSADASKVDVAFGGLVSQESGEDWTDAALTLSTAVPATASAYPQLWTWTIGERERFVPTPAPVFVPMRPAPRAAPPPPKAEDGDAALGEKLAARAATPADPFEDLAIAGEALGRGLGALGGVAGGVVSGEVGGHLANRPADSKAATNRPRPVPPPNQPEPEYQVAESDALAMSPPPATRSFSMDEVALSSSRSASAPTLAVSLAPPAGWAPPYQDPSSPAALSGGYALTYPSARAETVRSGQGARRVALFAKTWPVAAERRVFPALSSDAYLVAELANPSAEPLPGGDATLFVGDDPAGTARLQLVAPGEKVTLPLGLDRAVKPVRTVALVKSEQGVFSKDDVTQYVVTIELANPYPRALAVRVADQWPLAGDKDVEAKLVSAEPAAARDDAKGTLEWKLDIPASGKSVVKFSYTLRRPRGWRLRQ